MTSRVGIRHEDMYQWERRVPLIPQDVRELVRNHAIDIVVQSSPKRAYRDEEYRNVGITVSEDLSGCSVIVGIKEIPTEAFEEGKTYVFFSHTIKGQPYNMPMLKRMLELGCTLIDYEKVTDESDRRLIFFGNYAGLAGMIETLWALGRRFSWEGIRTPLAGIDRALDYADLATAKDAIRKIGRRISDEGLPESIAPLVVGFAGYGNVSRGAQEILDLLPVHEIAVEDLPSLARGGSALNNTIQKVVFKEEHMAEPIDTGRSFDLQEYYNHPERYRGIFERHIPHLDVLVNCIYWEPVYPRLLTKQLVREMVEENRLRVRVVGDISCDVEGAIECTVKATEPDNPVYVYDPIADGAIDGVEGAGPVVMAVEILPSELPREASAYFSGILKGYVPAIARADFSRDLESCGLPAPIRRAVIAYRGELTPDYRYIERYLSTDNASDPI